MAGSRIAVSAKRVEEMMRRLARAGGICLPAVSAAVHMHGGQVIWPRRTRTGDSPEGRGMQVTGGAGAGMSIAPMHHVLPKEHREWFAQRGFKGDMVIDQRCVLLEQAHHEAIHGESTGSQGAHGPVSGTG